MTKSKKTRIADSVRDSRPIKKKAPKYKSKNEKGKKFDSISAQKLSQTKDFTISSDPLVSYCVISFLSIFSTLSDILVCKKCKGDIKFSKSSEQGLGFHLHVKCMCSDTSMSSCPKTNNCFEVNRKIVIVMRLLGVGLAGIKLFTSMMDLGSNFGEGAYYSALEKISKVTGALFLSVVKKAGSEEKALNKEKGNPENELSVSGDGTWAKRGFSSLHGVITLIGKYTGKVLDLITKSSTCFTCQNKHKVLNEVDLEIWYESIHKEKCSKNHEGSAGKMEVDGIITMFLRSVKLHAAKYANYIGDGDSKTFKNLLDANVYTDLIVNKLECVLHVGKRMFRRLTEAKKHITIEEKLIKDQEKINAQNEKLKKIEEESKSNNLRNKKTEKKGGAKSKASKLLANQEKNKITKNKTQPKKVTKAANKGKVDKIKTTKLTGKVMREMSTYFSLAIQRHPDSIVAMKKEIWSGFYHKISTDDNPQHQLCDPSWCKYLQHQEKKLEYKHKPVLEPLVQKYVKDIYEDLSEDKLLKRCLGKNTQNSNESFNKTVWQFAPKHVYNGNIVVELSAWIAAIIFNEGFSPILKIYEGLGIHIGIHAANFAKSRDHIRMTKAKYVSTEIAKKRRSDQQQEKNELQIQYEEAEGLLYGPGITDDW